MPPASSVTAIRHGCHSQSPGGHRRQRRPDMAIADDFDAIARALRQLRGDPEPTVPATRPGADWFSRVQSEMLSLIAGVCSADAIDFEELLRQRQAEQEAF